MENTYSAYFIENLKYRLNQKWIRGTQIVEGHKLPKISRNPTYNTLFYPLDDNFFIDDSEEDDGLEENELDNQENEGEYLDEQEDNNDRIGIEEEYSIFSMDSPKQDCEICMELMHYLEIDKDDEDRVHVEKIICSLLFKLNMANEIFEYLKIKLNERVNIMPQSLIHWSSKKGAKIDLIRVLISLYDNKYFELENKEIPSQELLMKEFGKFLHIDLSNYDSDFSHSLESSIETNVAIFEKMKAKIQSKKMKKDS